MTMLTIGFIGYLLRISPLDVGARGRNPAPCPSIFEQLALALGGLRLVFAIAHGGQQTGGRAVL